MGAVLRALIGFVFIWMIGIGAASAATIDTKAREAILIDLSTNTVLFEKNADRPMPTSSMSKIMTMYMVFDALSQGLITLDDVLPVSEGAWRKGGSKMFVEVGDNVRVEDLVRGVIVQSGNDATIVLAEGLAGSEAAFAEQMTRKARSIGARNTNFSNASGWPDPQHYSTARDLARIAQRMIYDFPQYYPYWAEKEFTYAGIRQQNRNPLLYRNMGADGLKTGHTEDAGYGLVASAVRGERRLLLVINGLQSRQERADESARMLEWGFREFNSYTYYDAYETVENLPMWMGQSDTVPVVATVPIRVTVNRGHTESLRARIIANAPIAAPVAQGDRVGELIVEDSDHIIQRFPLVAGATVEEKDMFGKAVAKVIHLVLGSL